jgi:spore coat polysaccharide biosynthesis protein SpsF
MKPTVTAIIQARMNSTRLPGKAMMDLAGKPLLQHVFERIKATAGVDRVVLATCEEEESGRLIRLAESMGIDAFIGSRDNVLERFWQASEKFGGDLIMRATGDNPFTDPGFAALTIESMKVSGADLCYFPDLPLGTGVGMVKKSALDEAYHKSNRPHQFEHVTPYIREHPELFNLLVRDIGIVIPFPKLRLTVDTREDYELAKAIYKNCYAGTPFPLDDVVQFLKKNPGLLSINNGIEQRPMTHSSTQ